MSNPTSNFGWQMPTNSDLVTDLPADFEVFGQAVDTSLMDLKGGTTGQVLKKNSNTDMDFVWSADTGFTNPMTTTGDTIYSSSGSTPARLGIGTAGQVLQVNSGATAPEWVTISSGSMTQLASGSLSSTVTSITSISSAYKKLRLVVWDYYGSATSTFAIRVNNDATSSYLQAASQTSGAAMTANSSYLFLTQDANASTSDGYLWVDFDDYADTTHWKTSFGLSVTKYDGSSYSCVNSRGAYLKTDAINRIDMRFTNDQTMNGSYILYGVK